jgi:sensor histidine kinase regulating citrate/malate metabolism
VLKRATTEALAVEQRNEAPSQDSLQSESAPTLPSQTKPLSPGLPAGEGIGLSIVKRLCELLDASLELESSEGEGTTFRVIFPRHYADSNSN